MSGEVAGILLAAGGGTRFGRPKATLEFLGSPLVLRGVSTLTAGGCRPVCVVLGADAAQVTQDCELGSAIVVVNERWQDGGMASSLRVGLETCERANVAAAFVLHVDQPVVTPQLVARLIDAWRGGAKAAVAAFGKEGVTPVVLDRSLFRQVEEVAVGDQGARQLFSSHPELVTLVDCDDVGDGRDIDWPEDLQVLESAYRALVTTPGSGAPRDPELGARD